MFHRHEHDHAPQTLVGITFADIFRAQEFLTAVTGLAAHDKLKLEDAVIVVKNADGHTVVRETIDPQPGRSALSGAVWTSLLGLLVGGPVGWVAGAAIGAGAGAATAKLVDLGISDDWVAWFRDSVRPESASVVLLVSQVEGDALIDEAARFTGAQLLYANLDPGTLERFKEALHDSSPMPDTSDEPAS